VTVRPTAPTRPAAPVTRMGFAMVFLCAFTLIDDQIRCVPTYFGFDAYVR
jgi:hypothetical protein